MDLKARVVAYKDFLVIECLANASEKDVCTLSIDNPSCIGQVIHNTKEHLGISKEALEHLRRIKRSNDTIGEVDYFEASDKTWHFAWLGGPKALVDTKTAEGSTIYKVPDETQYNLVENIIPEEVIKIIDSRFAKQE